MLPPTSVGNFPAAMISPASVVVVVLPLPGDCDDWPGRNCAASSISPITGSPKSARLFQLRRVEGNARADYDQILAAEGTVAVTSGFDCDPVVKQEQDLIAQLGLGLGIGNGDRAPRDLRNNADATPDLPRPTTRTRLFLRSTISLPESHGGPRRIPIVVLDPVLNSLPQFQRC